MGILSDFIDDFSIPGAEQSVDGKIITIKINNEDIDIIFEIKLNITKAINRAEIWHKAHFVGRCSANDRYELSKKLKEMLSKEIAARSKKKIEKDINIELCDYLTGEFEKNGLEIVNKSSSVDFGSYIIKGLSGAKYQIKATYKDAMVQIKNVDNNMIAHTLATFNLSNPRIEKVICNALLKYEKKDES